MSKTKVESVDAEVIDTSTTALVITKMQPGIAIEANFDAIKARITAIVEPFVGAVVTVGHVAEAKKGRAYLNGLEKEISQRRVEVKRIYLGPVVAFEERVAEITVLIREASAAIDAQIKAIEEQERIDKRVALSAHWTECAGVLADVVPYEQIEQAAWLLKATPLRTALGEIEDKVTRIADDEATLDSLNLSHAVEAKAEFLVTLDVGRAIARSKALDEQEARARQLEADKAAVAAYKEERVPTPPFADTSPVEAKAEAAPVAETPREHVFTVCCTDAQLVSIIAYAKSLGVTGTASR